ncbi:MAG: GNAT family N-acetyltransferase [Streptosporangiales bacterium]|nr:GNAT family N-acetyltransferase [Streptosporangiales bacterium]
MTIRAAIRSDLGALLRLLALLSDDDPEAQSARMSSASVRAWTRIESDPDRTLLVAERRGELIGTLDLLVVPNLTHAARSWAIVENVVVAPAHRRRGIGRALVQEALSRAQEAGCYKVQLLSHQDRAEAHTFYAALGFETCAQGYRHYLEADQPSAAVPHG